MTTEESLKEQEKFQKIRNFYKNLENSITLIGMNDSQGVNVSSQLLKNTFFHIIKDALTDETLKPIAIDTFSLLFNKTEHMDYFLENNLSLEEIKYMQFYSYQEAIRKLLCDFHFPVTISEIGKHVIDFMKLVYQIQEGDDKIHLTDTLIQAKQPIFIYSSGANDLMRAYGNDPLQIKSAYRKRNKLPDFYYTKKQIANQGILEKTISNIEKNFNHILEMNPNTKIYTLGSYVPNALRKEEMNVFQTAIKNYNQALQTLCQKYHIHYINTYYIGNQFNQSSNNFHIEHKGHVALAHDILDAIHEDISKESILLENRKTKSLYCPNGNVKGVWDEIQRDYEHCLTYANELKESLSRQHVMKDLKQDIERRHMERQYEIAKEHQAEANVLKKTYQKTNR
ncbi:MAG: hypothetical protein KH135_03480 [Firmicutes bacterium]|nr:hypothetical protein [Bacillota bacterium]